MKSRLHHSPKVETMKCVRYFISGSVMRLQNEAAFEAVAVGYARFVPKKQWKEQQQENQDKQAA